MVEQLVNLNDMIAACSPVASPYVLFEIVDTTTLDTLSPNSSTIR